MIPVFETALCSLDVVGEQEVRAGALQKQQNPAPLCLQGPRPQGLPWTWDLFAGPLQLLGPDPSPLPVPGGTKLGRLGSEAPAL